MLDVKFSKAKQVLEDFELFEKIKKVALSHELSHLLSYITEEFDVNCYYKDDELVGFSFMEIAEEERLAELCWFIIDKSKSKLVDSKWFLDKTLEYCKSKGVQSVKFNCDSKSWGKINDKETLFKRFGYMLSPDEDFYDMSIDI